MAGGKKPDKRTQMPKVEGIRFADPNSAIYSTRLIVGSRHLGVLPKPGQKACKKEVLKRMSAQVAREAIAAIENPPD